jgi:hypothetical protein
MMVVRSYDRLTSGQHAGRISLRSGSVVENLERRGVAQPGSAPEWGSGGRRFKSSRPDSLQSRVLSDEC